MLHEEDIARGVLGDISLKVLQTDNEDGTGTKNYTHKGLVCRVFLNFPKL